MKIEETLYHYCTCSIIIILFCDVTEAGTEQTAISLQHFVLVCDFKRAFSLSINIIFKQRENVEWKIQWCTIVCLYHT